MRRACACLLGGGRSRGSDMYVSQVDWKPYCLLLQSSCDDNELVLIDCWTRLWKNISGDRGWIC